MERKHQLAVDLIAKWEGFSPTPYLCPAGVWTIGYGETKGITKNSKPITEKQAREMLCDEVIHRYGKQLDGLLEVQVTDEQYAALLSFTYNLGASALRRSTLLKKVNRMDWEGAANEFRKWVFANGKRLKGLVNRRVEEATLFRRTALV